MKLPDTIGEYQKISEIPTTKKYPYVIGMYKSPSGVEVVAKVWQGNWYNAHAFNLLHEADVCRVLDTIRLRTVAEMPEALTNIITPAYYDCLIQNKFMSKAQGTPLTQVCAPEEQLKIYNRILSYLKFIGKNATKEEQKIIGVKGIIYYISVYPIIFCLSIVRHITHSMEIIRSLYSFIFSLSALSHEPKILSHGDLHTDNILVSEDKITLLDLEQTIFTYAGFDAFTTVSSLRSLPDFRQYIEEIIKEEGKRSSRDASLLSGIGAFISTFNLTSNLSPQHVLHYVKILSISNMLGVLWELTPEMRLRSLHLPLFWGRKSS
jgi:hypothetical protein